MVDAQIDAEKVVAKTLVAPGVPVVPILTPAVDETKEDIIGKAMAAADRLEAANRATEALIARQERLAVQNTLGGSADAGGSKLTDSQKEDIEAKKMLVGTGFEDLML